MKIITVTLKDMEIREVDGEFQQVFFNEKRYPAAITNYSLSIGEKMGLLEGSQLTDLVKLSSLERLIGDIESKMISEETIKATEGIDLNKYLKVIYLSIIGLNKKLVLTYEDFLEKYHEDMQTVITTYVQLVLASMDINPNKFAKGLKDSTKKK